MAEENESPVSAAKPPVVNPIKALPTSHAATLKLKPVIRKPVVGAAGSGTLMWDIADTLNGLMAIPNLIALLMLSGVVTKLTKDYFSDHMLK